MHIPNGHALFTPMQKPALLSILPANIPYKASAMIFFTPHFLRDSDLNYPAHFRISFLTAYLYEYATHRRIVHQTCTAPTR
jgi:hypothetical protein